MGTTLVMLVAYLSQSNDLRILKAAHNCFLVQYS